MLTVGLTGSFGAGKSTVAKLFRRLGAKIIDADAINHVLIHRGGRCFKILTRTFGEGVFTNGDIDRKKMAEIVFNNPKQLKKLNRIVHPQVIKEIKKRTLYFKKNKNTQIIIIDAPLLIEAGLDKMADIVIVVKASRKTQIARVTRRMNIKRSEVLKRIKAQMALKEKIRRADIVIDNNKSLTKTKREVRFIWQKLWQKTRKK